MVSISFKSLQVLLTNPKTLLALAVIIPRSLGAKQRRSRGSLLFVRRSKRDGELVVENPGNEVGGQLVNSKEAYWKYPLLLDCLTIQIDLVWHSVVVRLFNEIFSPFNRFNQVLLVLFNLYNQLKILQSKIHREGHKQSEQFVKNKIGLLSIVLREDSAQLAHPIPVQTRIR